MPAPATITGRSANAILSTAFQTPDIGMLGYADPDGKVVLYRKPTRLHTSNTVFSIENIKELPVVDIVLSYAGANGTAIDAFIESGTEALIIASLAPGLPTPDQVLEITSAIKKNIKIIYSTRAGSGRVLRRESMVSEGIISADNLNPQKARVLAMLALTISKDPEKIQHIFDTH